MKGNYKDIIGLRFGRLLPIKRVEKNGSWSYWLCKCICGNETVVKTDNLTNGHTRSCGCYKLQRISESHKIHGLTNTRFQNIWRNMLDRCYNVKSGRYHRYGGRGISVYKRWHNFTNFIADMHKEYQNLARVIGEKNVTIERKDNDSDYYPDNCLWIHRKLQASNKHNVKKYLIGKKYFTIPQIAAKVGVPYMRVYKSLVTRKNPIDRWEYLLLEHR